MDIKLERFLKNQKLIGEGSDIWGGGTLPLNIKSYLSNEIPPTENITSVRCILLHQDSVLVMRNSDGIHIVPGGRIEKRESFSQTLKRELLEESGWSIAEPRFLGFMHFHHLSPKPLGYQYPHPDFIQLMYMAEAVEFMQGAKLSDDYEKEATFCKVTEVVSLGVPEFQRLYLEVALKIR